MPRVEPLVAALLLFIPVESWYVPAASRASSRQLSIKSSTTRFSEKDEKATAGGGESSDLAVPAYRRVPLDAPFFTNSSASTSSVASSAVNFHGVDGVGSIYVPSSSTVDGPDGTGSGSAEHVDNVATPVFPASSAFIDVEDNDAWETCFSMRGRPYVSKTFSRMMLDDAGQESPEKVKEMFRQLEEVRSPTPVAGERACKRPPLVPTLTPSSSHAFCKADR